MTPREFHSSWFSWLIVSGIGLWLLKIQLAPLTSSLTTLLRALKHTLSLTYRAPNKVTGANAGSHVRLHGLLTVPVRWLTFIVDMAETNHMRRSPRCQMAIDYAKKAYVRLGHSHATSAHLVLGLLSLEGGLGGTVLKQAGLSTQAVERYLSTKRASREEVVEREGAVFGKSVADALERRQREAGLFDHTILGVEHLILALLNEESGEAADLFASIHVDRDNVRRTIVGEME